MQAHVQAGSEPEQGGAVEPNSEPAGRMSDEMLIWARGREKGGRERLCVATTTELYLLMKSHKCPKTTHAKMALAVACGKCHD